MLVTWHWTALLYPWPLDVIVEASLLPHVLQREPEQEEQPDENMPPKFKRHLNDDEVTGSFRSERVRHGWCCGQLWCVK